MNRVITKKEWMQGCEKAYDLFHDNPEMIGGLECTVKRYAVGMLQLQLWTYNGEKGEYQYDTFDPLNERALTIMGGGKNANKTIFVRPRWRK
jgi:hypothetical protein